MNTLRPRLLSGGCRHVQIDSDRIRQALAEVESPKRAKQKKAMILLIAFVSIGVLCSAAHGQVRPAPAAGVCSRTEHRMLTESMLSDTRTMEEREADDRARLAKDAEKRIATPREPYRRWVGLKGDRKLLAISEMQAWFLARDGSKTVVEQYKLPEADKKTLQVIHARMMKAQKKPEKDTKKKDTKIEIAIPDGDAP